MTKLSKRAQIKDDLLQQLENAGLFGMHYVDLVDKYMVMWDAAKDLEKDWKKHGRMMEWNNGGGQKGIKPNPAGKEYRETNKRMTELLKTLGLKNPSGDGDDEEDV